MKKSLRNIITGAILYSGIFGISNNVHAQDSVPNSFYDKSWNFRASMQTRRRNVEAAVSSDNKIYVVGGYSGSDNRWLDDVERYSEETNQWSALTSFPYETSGIAMVSDNKREIYVIGGKDNQDQVLGNFFRYKPEEDSWEQLPSLNHPRSGHEAVSDSQGLVYVLGGASSDVDFVSTVEVYLPSKNGWADIFPLNEDRANFTALVDSRDRVFAIGGNNNNGETNSVEMFDPNNYNLGWQFMSPLSKPKQTQGTVGIDGLFYILDGWLPGYSSEVEVYDPEIDKWYLHSNTIRATNNSGVVTSKTGKIYSIGGDGDDTRVEVLNPFTPTPVKASIEIDPDIINKKINGGYIDAIITLPPEYNPKSINLQENILIKRIIGNSFNPLYFQFAESIPKPRIGDKNKDDVKDLTVRFDRRNLVANVSEGELIFFIGGFLGDGTPFIGSDKVYVKGR